MQFCGQLARSLYKYHKVLPFQDKAFPILFFASVIFDSDPEKDEREERANISVHTVAISLHAHTASDARNLKKEKALYNP